MGIDFGKKKVPTSYIAGWRRRNRVCTECRSRTIFHKSFAYSKTWKDMCKARCPRCDVMRDFSHGPDGIDWNYSMHGILWDYWEQLQDPENSEGDDYSDEL